MPLESLVGIDHEQVGTYANFIGTSALGQDMSHGGMVVKVGKCLIGLPYIALNVIVELGGGAGKCPKVWIGHLMSGSRAEVIYPVGIEDGPDEDDAVLFEGADLFLANGECFRRRNARSDAMGKGKSRIL